MSPASLTPAGTTGRTVLWCASSADQVLVDARTIRHLLAQHHRVTLATPEAAWEHVTADAESDEDRAHLLEQLASGGLRVLHPRASSTADARGLLHALHRTPESEPFTQALLGDPRIATLAADAMVVWPGRSRAFHLDAVDVATDGAATTAVTELLAGPVAAGELHPRAVLELADDVPGAVTPRQRVHAASRLVREDLWSGGTARLQRYLEDLAESARSAHDLAALVMLTFHRGLHADTLRSPLVEQPQSWLAPLRSTAGWQELAAERPRPVATPRPEASTAAPHVVLLPGTYGRFEGPVVRALEAAGCTVDLLDLAELAPALRRRNPTRENLALVRSLVTEGEHGLPAEAVERLAAADVIWAEWADLPAVWASHLAAPHQRMVVRLHSLDTLDPWLHLLRWSSVDALVAVGAPVARVAVEALGTRLDLPPVHVIGHVLDDHWFEVPSTEDAHRRLVMVKWGRRVKDPLRAVEILARLREHDPTWRLRLIGDDLRDAGERGPYARKFARRIEEDDVRDALEFVPHTDDVAGHLAGCGFVLSTSRRESFHLGVVEGAAAGCVPVVRDWPVFRRHGGARDVLPPHWVVDTGPDGVDAAVARILTHADRSAWEAGSAIARQDVRDHLDTQDTLRRLAAVALDRPDIPS